MSIEDSTAVISLTDAGGSPIEYDFAFIEENQTIVIENMKPVEFNLRKVDGSDKDLALANIEFQIHDAAGNIVQSVNQEDLIAMTNSDGLASFTEFEPGTYYLVENETTLPANYQGLRAPLEFTIERDAENQISLTLINANDNDAQVITEEESILLEIYNYRKGEYPDTGGPGSLLYYLAGSILIIIAGSVYYLKFIRRRIF